MNPACPLRLHARAAIIGASLLVSSAAMAATSAATLSDAQARYQKERAACMNGQSNQDRATCLKEAGAALDEARRGHLNEDGAAYQRNALARCDALPEAERSDCVARMHGDSTTVSGSVRDGGLLRERVTRQVGAPAAPGSDSAAPR